MKIIPKLNFPQKSIFGFKILSSLQSSISCYILLLAGKSLNIFFGSSRINIISGSLFNIILNLSIVILIVNLIKKRKQIKKIHFIFLNFILFIYLPISLFDIFRYSKILFFFLFKYSYQNNIYFSLSWSYKNFSNKKATKFLEIKFVITNTNSYLIK